MNSKLPILKTKLVSPTLNKNVVFRKSITSQICPEIHSGVTVLSAPAGYGKSTLVASWVSTQTVKCAWYSLSAADSDIFVFYSYLIESLKTAKVSDFDDIDEYCRSSIRDNFQGAAHYLLNELDKVEEPFSIILDDFHFINDKTTHEFVSYFILNIPSNCRLIIATREEPDLNLRVLRLQESYREFRSNELKFNIKEMKEFFSLENASIEEVDIYEIYNHTNGWPVFSKLVSFSLKADNDFNLKGILKETVISDYLLNIVKPSLPSQIQTFIDATISFNSFTVDMCIDILERSDVEECINYLVEAGVFLIQHETKKNHYRYHHLIHDVLIAGFDLSSLKNSNRYRVRAVEWLLNKKLFVDAFETAIETNEEQFILHTLTQCWDEIRFQYSDIWLVEFLSEYNESYCNDYPYVYCFYALNLLPKEPQKGISILRQINKSLNNSIANESGIKAICLIGEVYSAAINLDSMSIKRYGEQLETVLNKKNQISDSDSLWLGAVTVLYASTLYNCFNYSGALSKLFKALNFMEKSGNLSAIIGTYCLIIQLLYDLGQIKSASKYLKSAMSLLEGLYPPLPQGSGDLYVLCSLIELESANVESALKYSEIFMKLNEDEFNLETKHRKFLAMALLQVRTENWHLARTQLILAEKEKSYSPFNDINSVEILRVEIALYEHDTVYLQSWIDNLEEEQLNDRKLYDLEMVLYISVLQTLEKDISQYKTKLKMIIENAKENGDLRVYIKAKLIKYKELVDANENRALKELETICAESNKAGLMLLVSYSPQFQSTRQFIRNAVRTPLVSKFLLDDSSRPKKNNVSFEKLSKKEIEVLNYLSTEMNGPDICKNMYISLNTFRTHSKNIYGKLGVNSRMAAVNLAKELSLI